MYQSKKGKLTPKRERFCQEYLIDLNASAAARRAGYNEKSAYAVASELLRKVEIQNRLDELRKEQATKFNANKERLMNILMSIVSTEPKDFLDPETGEVLPPSEWPAHAGAAVSAIENDELFAGKGEDRTAIGIKRKVKLWDKNRAIEILNKMQGYNMPDKVAPTTPDGQALPIAINILPVAPKADD